ncbi:YccV-like-domain-containing protein [Aspergillus ruber CBS 135680]|uniref:YccV-like-domain-containing protein n=1 Tax=Aspergillus ruber (strain CBS 135680) TaxID=1388766 RepID=A0A017SJ35_ASPRC|nr:YccV-like-domain-containing protein [Aspergillus ruber CBS 135680]EYE96325.1 YccV-like-domain-containing protein [Aspergillus ruber CBS 135680]
MVLSLENLPEEVLYSILCYCHPTSSAALQQTARRFRNVTNEPLLWRFYCKTYFKQWDHRHRLPEKLASPVRSVNWKALYVSRHHIDRVTTNLLDKIIASQTGRINKFQMVVDFGYDTKDTLLRHLSVGPEADDYLARRYYAQALLTQLNRGLAIAEWAKIRTGEILSLERALGAFDLFIPNDGGGSLDDITTKLNEVAIQFISNFPNIGQLSSREKALAVASYLRTNNLTGIEPGREYHQLEHNFLGAVLDDPDHNALPLVSAAIYCYVAQKLGLNARPCGFPLHVHVIVTPALGFDIDGNALDSADQGEPMYLDPFHSQQETPISNLQSQLLLLGASDIERSNFLGESSIPQIVLRCGRNILNSIQRMQFPNVRQTQVDLASAKYAAFWSFMLFSGPAQPAERRHYLHWLMELFATNFPSDVYLVEQHIVPLLRGLPEYDDILGSLRDIRTNDEMPKQVRRRTTSNKGVRYRIGQVFRHRRYRYKAIVTGWDMECEASENWMRTMGIDRLQTGRHQSFYHVLVEDRSVRYVAEENIEPIDRSLEELPSNLTAVAGRHFKRWDANTRSFVSNIQDEYPDD